VIFLCLDGKSCSVDGEANCEGELEQCKQMELGCLNASYQMSFVGGFTKIRLIKRACYIFFKVSNQT
jgi:hypothetical protein